jgi:hypothetical protein
MVRELVCGTQVVAWARMSDGTTVINACVANVLVGCSAGIVGCDGSCTGIGDDTIGCDGTRTA